MVNNRMAMAILLGTMLVMSITGCGSSNNNNTTPSSSVPPAASSPASGGAVNAEAESLYKSNCIACHAVDLAGAGGPNLQHVGSELTVDQINTKIANGGGGMPAFKDKLTADEITILSTWLVAKT